MNVADLRTKLAALPDDMPVHIGYETIHADAVGADAVHVRMWVDDGDRILSVESDVLIVYGDDY